MNRSFLKLLVTVLAVAAACASPAAKSAVVAPPAPAAAPAPSPASSATPLGLRLPPSPLIDAAVQRGTRTLTGEPGPRYWQQHATYRLQAEVVPQRKRLIGQGTVVYENRSPDALLTLYFHLYPNLFAPDAKRNTQVMSALGGMHMSRVAANGKGLDSVATGVGWSVDGTILEIRLPEPLAAGARATLEFAWDYRIPPDGAPRGGQDTEVYFLSYWYPQVAVYDDVNGWQIDQYLGNAEFYMGYADYDVAYTVPEGWLVTSTGTLVNAADVLTPSTRTRLDEARAGTRVSVVSDDERGVGKSTVNGKDGKLTWRFTAQNVRDVTWATSALYLWDAMPVAVGDANHDGTVDTTLAQAFYRPDRRRGHWDDGAKNTAISIETYSRVLWPYPYPYMTAVDGPVSCGGMEYPMMTCIGTSDDARGFAEVVAHEVAHMWFPMLVGSDEKRYAWQDEGMAQFLQGYVLTRRFPSSDDARTNRRFYVQAVRQAGETELMHHGDRYPNDLAYGVASYYKPASVLVALRSAIGDSTFLNGMRMYGENWSYRHPTPWDFFHTMDRAAGQSLEWFWRAWYFETWKLDQAIEDVKVVGDSADVVIENKGRVPMPVPIAITRDDGTVTREQLPVTVWFDGKDEIVIRVGAGGGIRKVELDPEQSYPDIDRANQVWPKPR